MNNMNDKKRFELCKKCQQEAKEKAIKELGDQYQWLGADYFENFEEIISEKIKNNEKWVNVGHVLEVKKYGKKEFLEIISGNKISQEEYDKNVDACINALCETCNYKLDHTVFNQSLHSGLD